MPEQRTGSTSPLEQLNWTESELNSTDLCNELRFPVDTAPPKCYNPLPLQCLAAEALPDSIKKEIERVTKSSMEEVDGQKCSEDAQLDQVQKEEAAERGGNAGSSVTVPLQYFTNGSGLRLVGGVRCQSSDEIHAQIVSYRNCPKYEAVKESLHNGLCVLEFEGVSLQNCTFEEVRKLLKSTSKAVVKLTVRDCRCQQSCHTRGRSRTCSERDADPGDSNFLALRREKKNHYRYRPKQLALSSQLRSDPGHSPTPPASTSVSSDIEETTPIAETKILKQEMGGGKDEVDLPYVHKGPNGMAKISLRYNQGEETLYVCIFKLKRRTSVTTEQSGIFINTSVIPDKESQGVKHGRVVHSKLSTEEILEQSASYHIPSSEVHKTSLRVSVWECSKKKPIFRGEVFFHLNDSHIVNLQAVARWYPICDPDPNLPPLPTPFHKHGTLLDKMKASLGTPFVSNTLKKKKKDGPSKAQSLMDISQSSDALPKNDLQSILAPLKNENASSPNSNRLSFIEFLSELDDSSQTEETKPMSSVSHTRSKSSQFLDVSDASLLGKPTSDNTSICSEGAAYTTKISFVDFLSSLDRPSTQLSSRPESGISQDSFLTTSSGTNSSRSSVQADNTKDYTKYEGDNISESGLTLLNYWSSPKRYTAKLIRKYSFIDTLEDINRGSASSSPSIKTPSPQTTPQTTPQHSTSTTTIKPDTDHQEKVYDHLTPKISLNGFPLYKYRRGSVDTVTSSYNKYHSNSVEHPLSVSTSCSRTSHNRSPSPYNRPPCSTPLKKKLTSTPAKEMEKRFYKGISKSLDDIVGMDDSSSLMEFDLTSDDYIVQEESSLDTPGLRRALLGENTHLGSIETESGFCTESSEVSGHHLPLRNTQSDEVPQTPNKKVIKRQNKSQPTLKQPTKSKTRLSPKFAYKWLSMEALIESDSSPETEKREKVLPALALRKSEGQYGALKKLQEAYENGKLCGGIHLMIVGKAIASTLSIKISDIVFYNNRLMNTDFSVKVKLYNRFNEECEMSEKGQIVLRKSAQSVSKEVPPMFEFSGNPSVYHLQVALKLSGRVFNRKVYQTWIDLQKVLSSASEYASWFDLKA